MTMSNGYAGRDDFFAETERRYCDVTLWNGRKSRLRSITAGEWLNIDAKNVNMKSGGLNPSGVRVSDLRLVIATVCDADGKLLFTEADIPRLESIDSRCILPVLKDARIHCGIKDDVEASLKNCETTQGGDSPTSS